MCHHFHPSILREYDVRGVFQETLHPEDAFFVGRCYATFLSGAKPKVAVAWDGRLSSPILKESLIEGLQASGMEVVEIGVGPTPLLYFSVHHMKLDGGIMVTGSHNPKNHNGFKMMFKDHIITGPEIHSFQEIVKSFPKDVALGGRKSEDLSEAYVQRLLKDLKIEKKDLNIVWDAGNGAAGQLVEMLIQRIPGKHTALFCDIDGTFPNHHPDPSKAENLADLKKMVLKNKANLGFAFDGDGDRLGVVDEKGDPLPVDQLIMMLAREVLKGNPGATVISDVKASQALFEDIEAQGGAPLMWKTGHSTIKRKMKDVSAPFAGEISGHVFFNDYYYGYDDALYTAIRFLNIFSALGKPLSEVRKNLPSYVTSDEVRIPYSDDKKFAVVADVLESVEKSAHKDFSDIDGLRVNYSDGWWLLRASNTQAMLVYRAEGVNEKALKDVHKRAQKYLKPHKIQIS